jgi:hypothetical protein
MDVAERGGGEESNIDNWVVILRGSLRHGSSNDVIDPLNHAVLEWNIVIAVIETLTIK